MSSEKFFTTKKALITLIAASLVVIVSRDTITTNEAAISVINAFFVVKNFSELI